MAELVPALSLEVGACLDTLGCCQSAHCEYLVYSLLLAALFVCFGFRAQYESDQVEVESQRAAICITLCRLSGATHELAVPRNIDIRTLKESIENSLPYPVGCQQLVHETLLLEDHMLLSSLCKEGEGRLQLSLMLSSEFLKDMLRLSQSHCEYFRLRAISVFRTLGTQAGDIGVKALLNCLQDCCRPLVRRRALDALLQMASVGDQRSILSLPMAMLLVPESDCKLLVQVWLQLLKGHNRYAANALCKLLKYACMNRQQSVCTLLREVRMESGPSIVEAAGLLKQWSVGSAKPEATFFLLSMGNEHAQTEWKQFRRKGWKPKRDRCMIKIQRSRRALILKQIQAEDNEPDVSDGIASSC